MEKYIVLFSILFYSISCQGNEDKASLLKMVEKIPPGWKPVIESAEAVHIAYWDKEHFLACSKKDTASYGNKLAAWVSPSYSRAYFLLAYMSIEAGNANEAKIYIDKGLELEPDSPKLLHEKGIILQQLGDHESAVNTFTAVMSLTSCVTDHERARALRGKGISLIDLGKLKEAAKSLFESLRIEPDNKIAINELNYIMRIASGSEKNLPIGISKEK